MKHKQCLKHKAINTFQQIMKLNQNEVSSASGAQRIAGAAHRAGASTLVRNIGAGGKFKANAERDIHRLGRRVHNMRVPLFHVETVVRDPRHLVATLL